MSKKEQVYEQLCIASTKRFAHALLAARDAHVSLYPEYPLILSSRIMTLVRFVVIGLFPLMPYGIILLPPLQFALMRVKQLRFVVFSILLFNSCILTLS